MATGRLTSPTMVKELLKRHQLTARKRYGQNFLVDQNILLRIIAAAELPLGEDTQLLEIGPGLGTLSRHLADLVTRLVAVEIDRDLQPVLQETLSGCHNIEMVFGDALKLDLNQLMYGTREPSLSGEAPKPLPTYVVANLPYYITSPLISTLLQLEPLPLRLVLMVQKEVGERICAAPGTKQYGSLSVYVQALCIARIEAIVPATVFYPQPDVSSCLLVLQPFRVDQREIASLAVLELTNRAIFGQRRKTLFNALSGSPHWQLGDNIIHEAISKLGLNPKSRGEQLTVAQVIALANELASGSME